MALRRGDVQSTGFPSDGYLSGGESSQQRPERTFPEADPDLLRVALHGDMKAFGDLFERFRPDLYAICLRRLEDASLAEDAVQDTFEGALLSLPRFQPGKKFWPWLLTIARRRCIDIQRRRSWNYVVENPGDTPEALRAYPTDTTSTEVIAGLDRAEIRRAFATLPPRQRRALLLYALEGYSYSDIAEAEGVSLGTVKLLLVRARKKMRSACQSGPLPAVVLPFTWLRWKIQRLEERVRSLLGVYSDGFSSICMQAACLGTVAIVVIATANPNGGRDDPGRFEEAVLSATPARLSQTASLQIALPNSGGSTQAPVEPRQPVANSASSLVNDVINPNQNATPENSFLYSIKASPDYENNHTIVASGQYWQRHVLFVSQDGGASWKPQVSRLPVGIQYDMVFSPDYPQDRRTFTLGELGLLQSDDGGEIFRTVSPSLGWSIAISPSFGKGDSRLFMGGKTLLEYDVDLGVTRPGLPALPLSSSGGYPSLVVSPGYRSDRTIFVSDWPKNALGNPRYDQAILYRCEESVCDEMQFSIRGPLTLRLSPRFDQDGLAYAFTDRRLLASNDGGRTFRDMQFPLPDYAHIVDVAILWKTLSDPEIFASVPVYTSMGVMDTPGIYRSIDAGHSWDSTSIEIPGFSTWGAQKLIVTPTGRLLATGSTAIACSENRGQTWAPRCTPE